MPPSADPQLRREPDGRARTRVPAAFDPSPSPRVVAALVLAVLCVVGTVVLLAAEVALSGAPRPPLLEAAVWGSTVPGTTLVLAGAVLALHVPRHPMTSLLLVGGGLTVASGAATGYALWSLLREGGDWPATAAAVQLGSRAAPWINLVPPLVLLLFPDGRLPSARWRAPVALSLAGSAFAVLVFAAAPWHVLGVDATGVVDDPVGLGLSDDVWAACVAVAPWLIATSPVVPAVVFLSRFRAADRERRAQLRWMLLAAGLNLALMVVPALAGPGRLTDLAFVLSMCALAGAVLVAVTRYRLYDIDQVFGRVLVHGLLAAAVIALDVAVFVGAGAVLDEPAAAVLGAGAVAVAYAPLRTWVERIVARFAGRIEPYAVVSELAGRLERAEDPRTQMAQVARTVATTVGSPYVRVELDRADGGTDVAEFGSSTGGVVVLPLSYRAERIGRLTLVPPVLAPPLARQRLLGDVVRQAAAAARLAAVTEELERSRAELVTRVAEERRRLRRDLHDGLGPTLAAAALKVQAGANLAGRDPVASRAALHEVADDLADVLADVRRLVHDLRPAALDEVGLAAAVRRLATRFPDPPRVVVEVPETTGLPPATEEAAYHLAGEALANAVRHAQAAVVRIVLAVDPAEGLLTLDVTDDGRGMCPDAPPGVGIPSMRGRAEAVGGTLVVEPRRTGGTRVHARLPLTGAHGEDTR